MGEVPTVLEAIEDGIGTASWPNGERFVHLAKIHRLRVAEHVMQSLHVAGYRITHVNEDWREGASSREALRSELIRQHLAGECDQPVIPARNEATR